MLSFPQISRIYADTTDLVLRLSASSAGA